MEVIEYDEDDQVMVERDIQEDDPAAVRDREDGEADGLDTGGKRAARASVKRAKRPKLTVALLKQDEGLPDVFKNFPKYFADGFRGRGHEVSDLRRLIELYQRWHHRVFPHGTFDAFQQSLEKLSSTNELRTELRRMRVELMKMVDPEEGPALGDMDEQWKDVMAADTDAAAGAGAGAGAAGAAGATTPAAAAAVSNADHEGEGQHEPIDDDDVLLQLQAQETDWAEAEEAVPEAFCEIPAPSQPTQRAATAGPSAVQPSPPATASQLRRKAVAGSAGQTGQAVAAAGDGEDGAGLEDEDLDGGAMAPAARRGFGSGGRRRALADWSDDDDSDDGMPMAAAAAASTRQQQLPQQVQQEGQQEQPQQLSMRQAGPREDGEQECRPGGAEETATEGGVAVAGAADADASGIEAAADGGVVGSQRAAAIGAGSFEDEDAYDEAMLKMLEEDSDSEEGDAGVALGGTQQLLNQQQEEGRAADGQQQQQLQGGGAEQGVEDAADGGSLQQEIPDESLRLVVETEAQSQ